MISKIVLFFKNDSEIVLEKNDFEIVLEKNRSHGGALHISLSLSLYKISGVNAEVNVSLCDYDII